MKIRSQTCWVLILFCIISIILSQTANGESATDKGEKLYIANCAKCHGISGEGYRKLYPPLQNSRFLKNETSQLPCVIRHGMKGKITVEDIVYNQIMPGNKRLSPEDIAYIIQYMQHTWNHPEFKITVDKWLTHCL